MLNPNALRPSLAAGNGCRRDDRCRDRTSNGIVNATGNAIRKALD